jgi:hypothetical protein
MEPLTTRSVSPNGNIEARPRALCDVIQVLIAGL